MLKTIFCIVVGIILFKVIRFVFVFLYGKYLKYKMEKVKRHAKSDLEYFESRFKKK